MTQYGFKIIDMPEVQQGLSPASTWRRVNVFDFAIETHPNCPIDGTAFETIAALVSLTNGERLRVGCCPRCGLVGYIDRPSQADIDRYYAEIWMGETPNEARDLSWSIAIAGETSKQDIDTLSSLPLDRDLPVLEIGCGYGRTIKALRESGFANIDATEHCPARAESVRQVFGINVTADMPRKRYGLIVSYHVLEHVVDPAGLIRACAERQEKGDIMWHTMPAFESEPSMGILLFLPHLWSFNYIALRQLQELNGGYLVYSDDRPSNNLSTIAKRSMSIGPYFNGDGHLARAIEKLLCGLSLIPQRSVLTWQRDSDGCAWKSLPYAAQAVANNFPRSIVVEPVNSFITDAPIEVQFQERVQAYIK